MREILQLIQDRMITCLLNHNKDGLTDLLGILVFPFRCTYRPHDTIYKFYIDDEQTSHYKIKGVLPLRKNKILHSRSCNDVMDRIIEIRVHPEFTGISLWFENPDIGVYCQVNNIETFLNILSIQHHTPEWNMRVEKLLFVAT